MPNRIAMGVATWWDPVGAALLTLAAITGLVVLGGRIYTRAILHTGAAMSLGEAWRGAPLPSDSHLSASPGPAKEREVRSVTGMTGREDRTQLILIVIAVAVGGVVFVLANDFVIGVGVGAAVFAVARQALRVWGRGSGDAHVADEPERESVER